MTSCPVCNKPVDPIRARFVAVREGKVVAYCSPECRDRESSQPTKVPAPAPAPAPAAGPPRPKTPPAGTPKTLADLDSGPVIEIVREASQPSGAKEDVVVEPTTKARPDGSKGSGGADSASISGEVTEPKRARTRPSGKHLTRERTDSTEARAGWDWLEDEPAEHARPGTYTESERRTRWPFVLVLVIAVLGGGGYLVMKYVVAADHAPERPPPGEASGSASAPAEHPVMPDAPAAAAPSKADAVRAARALLLHGIEDGTDRMARTAAMALGRTGDPAAVAALQQAVKAERVNAGRILAAYALARAGDKAGRDALVSALALPDRSDKLDAATKLAWLGDERGRPLLSSLLGLGQHKLRAAEELARFKDPEALKLLEQIRTDTTSSADEQATATIALYRAGEARLAGDVKQLLEVKSWRAFAAYALAEVDRDPAVKADLVEQVTQGVGVKVRAAYALRKLLGDDTDALVPALVAALGSQKDTEQYYAAEAILILAGEPGWAEYP